MKIDKTGKQMSIHGMMRMLKIVIGANNQIRELSQSDRRNTD